MIRILTLAENTEWDSIVRSFPNYDVYYLSGYTRAFQLHGDGDPHLLYYEDDGLRAIYVYMLRGIATGLYDTITPYGYGGVLFDGDTSTQKIEHFREEYEGLMQQQGVVSNFVRYHPVLCNAEPMRQISNVVDLGKTIAIDLKTPEVIWENIHSKNRNVIRKAERSGIVIKMGQGMELFNHFIDIYNATMKRDNAEAYYYFGREFYTSLDRDLHDHYQLFYAEFDGQIVAMSIMLFANGRLNYHLSGSLAEYRHLAPSNLLLYKAAIWGYEQGMTTFHLGGGVGSGEDNLYKFKAAFNRHSDCRFSIGKQIFNHNQYRQLAELKHFFRPEAASSTFFPQYR